MKKNIQYFSVDHPKESMVKMLNWSSRFNIFCFLDNSGYQFEEPAFDVLLAAGATHVLSVHESDPFISVRHFHEQHPGWLFGHIAYPATYHTRQQQNQNVFSEPAFFFSPQYIVEIKGHSMRIETGAGEDPGVIFGQISSMPSVIIHTDAQLNGIRETFSRNEYISIVESLKKHIRRGDCYEVNFCQEYIAEQAIIDPLSVFQQMRLESPNPFSAFYRLENKYCLCASPERFLNKRAQTVISQPIKGTSRRHLQDPEADNAALQYLVNSPKEKAENVMVVDLVRNDLSRVAMEGSVHVTELFGVYAFPQVFHMISTIEGRVDDSVHWTSILEACFPMGSMTGAPKRRVMELIGEYELQPRGLFSGTIGYVTPEGDMDFNVVIRSLFYDDQLNLLTFNAGSAITAYCDAAAEYEECGLKTAAIRKILSADQ